MPRYNKEKRYYHIYTLEEDIYLICNGQKGFAPYKFKIIYTKRSLAWHTKKILQEGFICIDTQEYLQEIPLKGLPSHSELEQTLIQSIDNTEAWWVYGDWLQIQGNIHGELINLHNHKLLEQAYEIITTEYYLAWLTMDLVYLMAKHTKMLTLEWKYGFIIQVFIHMERQYTVSKQKQQKYQIDYILKILFQCQVLNFLSEFSLYLAQNIMPSTFDIIAKSAPFPALKIFNIEQIWGRTYLPSQYSLNTLFPLLQRLTIKVIYLEINELQHKNLQNLSIFVNQTIIFNANILDLPQLEKLEIGFQGNTRFDNEIENFLTYLLTKAELPKISYLSFKNIYLHSNRITLLQQALFIKNLEVLDLSYSVLNNASILALVQLLKQQTHFKKIYLLQTRLDANKKNIELLKSYEKVFFHPV